MRKITKCKMCGRGICDSEFCNSRCEEYFLNDFKIGYNYENDYKVRNWIVIAGNEEWLRGFHVRV